VIAPEEASLASRDGMRLRLLRFRPAGAPRSALVVVHGLAEHAGRYLHVGDRFASRGHAVYAADCRGHGKSDGLRVHVERFDQFVDDVAAARTRAAAENPGVPLVLVGHSQGGLVALRSALLAPQGLDALVLSSPLLGAHPSVRPSRLLAAAARVLSVVAPRVLLANHVNADTLATDPEVGRAYLADPLVSRRVSPRWYTELQRAIADTHAKANKLARPALVMVPGDDRLVDAAATVRFVEAAPPALVELVRWDGFRHELFNESQRERVFERIDAFLDRRLARSAS
jgi:alpha-beta hydrolase superfamily lysophospholipase